MTQKRSLFFFIFFFVQSNAMHGCPFDRASPPFHPLATVHYSLSESTPVHFFQSPVLFPFLRPNHRSGLLPQKPFKWWEEGNLWLRKPFVFLSPVKRGVSRWAGEPHAYREKKRKKKLIKNKLDCYAFMACSNGDLCSFSVSTFCFRKVHWLDLVTQQQQHTRLKTLR